jgi:hypothetical protein
VRRLINQAWWDRIEVEDEGIGGGRLTEQASGRIATNHARDRRGDRGSGEEGWTVLRVPAQPPRRRPTKVEAAAEALAKRGSEGERQLAAYYGLPAPSEITVLKQSWDRRG